MGIDTQNTQLPDTEMPDTQLPDSELPDTQMPDSDELAWDALAALHSKVEQRLAKALQRQHGLGLSDYRALSRLAAADQGGMRISELAEALALNESSVSRLADRLEQAGLTERCVCEDDRRGVYAFITDAGREQLRSAIPTYRAQLAAALDQASADPAVAAPVTALRTARLRDSRHARVCFAQAALYDRGHFVVIWPRRLSTGTCRGACWCARDRQRSGRPGAVPVMARIARRLRPGVQDRSPVRTAMTVLTGERSWRAPPVPHPGREDPGTMT